MEAMRGWLLAYFGPDEVEARLDDGHRARRAHRQARRASLHGRRLLSPHHREPGARDVLAAAERSCAALEAVTTGGGARPCPLALPSGAGEPARRAGAVRRGRGVDRAGSRHRPAVRAAGRARCLLRATGQRRSLAGQARIRSRKSFAPSRSRCPRSQFQQRLFEAVFASTAQGRAAAARARHVRRVRERRLQRHRRWTSTICSDRAPLRACAFGSATRSGPRSSTTRSCPLRISSPSTSSRSCTGPRGRPPGDPRRRPRALGRCSRAQSSRNRARRARRDGAVPRPLQATPSADPAGPRPRRRPRGRRWRSSRPSKPTRPTSR